MGTSGPEAQSRDSCPLLAAAVECREGSTTVVGAGGGRNEKFQLYRHMSDLLTISHSSSN